MPYAIQKMQNANISALQGLHLAIIFPCAVCFSICTKSVFWPLLPAPEAANRCAESISYRHRSVCASDAAVANSCAVVTGKSSAPAEYTE